MIAEEDANKLTAVVHGIIANVPVPFPIDNPDACKDSNIGCPVKNGQHYLYKSTIFVKETYPKVDKPDNKICKYTIVYNHLQCNYSTCILFVRVIVLFQLSLAVRWELQDENGVDVVCILIPAKIVD
jgi:Niemann-Pick C2 protein